MIISMVLALALKAATKATTSVCFVNRIAKYALMTLHAVLVIQDILM